MAGDDAGLGDRIEVRHRDISKTWIAPDGGPVIFEADFAGDQAEAAASSRVRSWQLAIALVSLRRVEFGEGRPPVAQAYADPDAADLFLQRDDGVALAVDDGHAQLCASSTAVPKVG